MISVLCLTVCVVCVDQVGVLLVFGIWFVSPFFSLQKSPPGVCIISRAKRRLEGHELDVAALLSRCSLPAL